MRKIFVAAALVLAALSASAEVVSRDTVAYTGTYKLDKIEKTNNYGEISVRYVAYLDAIKNAKGEPRKVSINKSTYESGVINAIVYNNDASGNRKIAKAINKESK